MKAALEWVAAVFLTVGLVVLCVMYPWLIVIGVLTMGVIGAMKSNE